MSAAVCFACGGIVRRSERDAYARGLGCSCRAPHAGAWTLPPWSETFEPSPDAIGAPWVRLMKPFFVPLTFRGFTVATESAHLEGHVICHGGWIAQLFFERASARFVDELLAQFNMAMRLITFAAAFARA